MKSAIVSQDSATSEMSVIEPKSNENPRAGWRLWMKDEKEKAKKRFLKEYNGGRGFNGKYWYRRPSRAVADGSEKAFDIAGVVEAGEDGKYEYLNKLGQVSRKYQDVDTYLSTTNNVPRRLIVQATPHVCKSKEHGTSDWRRRQIEGSVPTALKMAEWALSPADKDIETGKRPMLGRLQSLFRTMIVAFPLQVLLALPGVSAPWEDDNIDDNYLDYPGYHWKWAKHAVNPLDQRPSNGKVLKKPDQFSSKIRLLRPRQLLADRDGAWILEPHPTPDMRYIFISYANIHFHTDTSEEGRQEIKRMAAYAAGKAGCSACWLDFECRAPQQGELLTSDVNRMCDVIRGAERVVVMLPDQQNKPNPKTMDELLEEWGNRMWTLPEGLLAPGDVHFCQSRGTAEPQITALHKTELSDRAWKDTDVEDPPTRILAECYQGNLDLSRLELFSTALTALGDREPGNLFTDADIAYALMGLLHFRIEPDETDSIFQAIARLSLANDNDRLIERMVCMYPKDTSSFRNLFKTLSHKDQYETRLWDITPLCQVVGVGDEPDTVLLNGCKAIPIRWKQFPKMHYKRHQGFKKFVAEMFVRSGAWWIVAGVSLAWTYAPFLLAGAQDGAGNYSNLLTRYLLILFGAFLAVGFVLSFFGPRSVRRLFGGAVMQTTPHLIGFEGVMPIHKLEKIIFGNTQGRLSYEASSTPFCRNNRDPVFRQGVEPSWVKNAPDDPEPPLAPGQRLFTLVDTGSLTVSLFAAQRPPTVALICGSEGGMLRAVLCSWRFSTDCLFREAVMRMSQDTWEMATAKSWLKVSLGNQEDFKQAIQWQKETLWKKKNSVSMISPTSIGPLSAGQPTPTLNGQMETPTVPSPRPQTTPTRSSRVQYTQASSPQTQGSPQAQTSPQTPNSPRRNTRTQDERAQSQPPPVPPKSSAAGPSPTEPQVQPSTPRIETPSEGSEPPAGLRVQTQAQQPRAELSRRPVPSPQSSSGRTAISPALSPPSTSGRARTEQAASPDITDEPVFSTPMQSPELRDPRMRGSS